MKFPKLGLSPLWRPITSYANFWLRWGPKQSCSPGPKLLTNMWHGTYTHVIHGDFWLLVVENQIDTLIPNLSFDHNLCCKYSNGSCEPILDIYVLISFQWYKEIFSLMNFDPSNYSLKIWESIRIPTPKMGVHLGMCGLIPSHYLALLGVWLPSYTLDPHLSMPLPWLRA
jgi:hypothetical protein